MGGAGNLRIMKRPKKSLHPCRFNPFFCPHLGVDQKKRSSLRFSPFFRPGLGEDQNKKKKQRKKVFNQFYCPDFLPKFQRGAMTQFCALYLGIYALLAPQIRPCYPAFLQLLNLNTSSSKCITLKQQNPSILTSQARKT